MIVGDGIGLRLDELELSATSEALALLLYLRELAPLQTKGCRVDNRR